MKIFKKILIGLGVLFVGLGLTFTGLIYWASEGTAEHNAKAIPYINEIVPELSKWKIDAYEKHFMESVYKDLDKEQLAKVIEYFSKLGALKSLEKPQLQTINSHANTSNGVGEKVIYKVKGNYEKGPADIDITLHVTENGYELYHFYISSTAFLE